MNPYRITDGSAPSAAGEVAVDSQTAQDNDLKVGDQIKVLTQAGSQAETISGIVSFGDGGSLAGATVTLFDPTTAQVVLGTKGTFSEILVVGDGSVSDTQLQGSGRPRRCHRATRR